MTSILNVRSSAVRIDTADNCVDLTHAGLPVLRLNRRSARQLVDRLIDALDGEAPPAMPMSAQAALIRRNRYT